MRFIIIIASVLLTLTAQAQTGSAWSSPEVEQMYNNARGYLMQGNFAQAITTYQQAIKLAPDKMVLFRDLANAYHLSGNNTEAINIIEPIIKSGEADEETYQIYTSSVSAAGDKKKAKQILTEGVRKFPTSGILNREMGLAYEQDNDLPNALRAWLSGISSNPGYHLNYYDAARTYMGTNKVIWAVIYAEMFVNIEQHTPRADETRDMLLGAYMRLYDAIGSGTIPSYKAGSKATDSRAGSFEEAVYNTYQKLSPVVSDGINTENLTMLRTRFMLEWNTKYAARFPFSMFSRMNEMLSDGYFDIYNQWLFGYIDNPQQFDAWKTFHPDAISKFEQWLTKHHYTPLSTDNYNTKQVDGIFLEPAKDANTEVQQEDDKAKKKKKR